jgi:hypothetical protein
MPEIREWTELSQFGCLIYHIVESRGERGKKNLPAFAENSRARQSTGEWAKKQLF